MKLSAVLSIFIDRHLRDIHPLLDYDASESQFLGLIEIGLSAQQSHGLFAIAKLLVINVLRQE